MANELDSRFLEQAVAAHATQPLSMAFHSGIDKEHANALAVEETRRLRLQNNQQERKDGRVRLQEFFIPLVSGILLGSILTVLVGIWLIKNPNWLVIFTMGFLSGLFLPRIMKKLWRLFKK